MTPPTDSRNAPRLKTCETCFRAKIRCDRTQDSGSCDRCLRLHKECVFAVARHGRPHVRHGRSTNDSNRLEVARQRVSVSPIGIPSLPFSASLLDDVGDDKAAMLLQRYSSRMLPHFPFVHIPANETPRTLREQRPCLYIAILSAASYDDNDLQRRLSQSFNATVAEKMVHGNIASLDLLQGILVHSAWFDFSAQKNITLMKD